MANSTVVGKTILELDLHTGEINIEKSYIEIHVDGRPASNKIPLSVVISQGKSSYEIAQEYGFEGTPEEWLASLVGPQGDSVKGDKGDDGASALDIISLVYPEVDTPEKLAEFLKGEKGEKGDSIKGDKGNDGEGIYELAVRLGFQGTEEEYAASIAAPSNYKLAQDEGFEGSLSEWLETLVGPEGPAGPRTVIGNLIGVVSSPSDLPPVAEYENSDYFFVEDHVYMNVNGEWFDLGNFRGLPGKDGSGIAVLGEMQSVANLPEAGDRNGDAWLIGKSMFVWNGERWQEQGQEGLRGEKGDKGDEGKEGKDAFEVVRAQYPDVDTIPKFVEFIRGETGDKGDTGVSFVALGVLATTDLLPEEGLNNHGYLVGETEGDYEFHVWVQSQWVNLGNNTGPRGLQGEEGKEGKQGPAGKPMLPKGILESIELLPQEGAVIGETYGIDGHFHAFDGVAFIDMGNFRGPEGKEGKQGPVGQPINPKGDLASEDDLPETAEVSDAYEIGGFIYVYDGTEFVRMGRWTGMSGKDGKIGKDAYEHAVDQGFVGNLDAWLASLRGEDGNDGKDGIGFSWIGIFDKVEDLPTGDQTGKSATVKGTPNHLYLWRDEWIDNGPLSERGEAGASAFDDAVAGGFSGTKEEWLLSLVGPTGASAYEDAVKSGFEGDVEAWLLTLNGEDGSDGKDAYQVAVTNGYEGDVAGWLKSLEGESAYQIAVRLGYEGTEAEWLLTLVGKGEKGDKGNDGVSFRFIGTFEDEASLPTGELSNTATVAGDIFIHDGTNWVNGGPASKGVKGDTGASAYEDAVAGGFEGTKEEWLTSLHGKDGESIKGDTGARGNSLYEDAVEKELFTGTLEEFLTSQRGEQGPHGQSVLEQSIADGMLEEGATIVDLLELLTGPVGPEGKTGPAISIVGVAENEAALPEEGVAGQGYAILDPETPDVYDCWIWLSTTSEWMNLGHVVGAKGEKGDEGKRGLQGLRGIQGEQGEEGTRWIIFDREPQAQDGRVGDFFYLISTQEFYQKTSPSTWSLLGVIGGGNMHKPAPSEKTKGFKSDAWVDIPLVDDIPTSDGAYLLQDGEWTRFDIYDLKAIDVEIADAKATVDFKAARIFRINNTGNATINLTNLPAADRGTTIVVKVYGKVGSFQWTLPSGTIRWMTDGAPNFMNDVTTVVFSWDGREMAASVPDQ